MDINRQDLTKIGLVVIAIIALLAWGFSSATAQDDNDVPTPTQEAGDDEATPQPAATRSGNSTGGGSAAAPTRPSNRTILTNAFRLPTCEELVVFQPLQNTFIPGERILYRWALKPVETNREEVLLFDLIESNFELFLFDLPVGNALRAFGWQGNLEVIPAQAGDTPRTGQAIIAPFEVTGEPRTYGALIVFYDANGNALCRSGNNNWVRTDFDEQGNPLVCGASDLNQIAQICAPVGTLVAQAGGAASPGTGTGSGTGGGGGGGGGVPPVVVPPPLCRNGAINPGETCDPSATNTNVDGCTATCLADGDNDEVDNATDNCPANPNADQLNTDAAADGGNACDTDDDNDTVLDGVDNCPLIIGLPIDNGCPPVDTDADGVNDGVDNCPTVSNAAQTNGDGDARGDACDNCPALNSPDQSNTDGDTLGNVCDSCPNDVGPAPFGCPAGLDTDGDGVTNAADNCPTVPNAAQTNGDGDTRGDACDNCIANANNDQANADADAQGDVCDPDDDNDTILDGADNCPLVSNVAQTNTDGTPDGGDACDPDDDNDTVLDGVDNCPLVSNLAQTNSDGDALGDACDTLPFGCQLTPHPVYMNGGGAPPFEENFTGDIFLTSNHTCTDRPFIITGNNNANVIEGTPYSDLIYGLAGADFLKGFGGDDTLDGGPDGDILHGGTGDDVLTGGAGNDAIFGGDNATDNSLNDTFSESASVANLFVILNANGTGTSVGEGNDALNGIEHITTGLGNDSVTLNGNLNNNRVNLTSGTDSALVVQNSGGSGNVSVTRSASNVTVSGGGIGTDTIQNVDQVNVTGSDNPNTFIMGDSSVNVITAGVSTTDTYSASTAAAAITINLNAGVANLTGATGADTTTGVENFITGSGADSFLVNDVIDNAFTAGAGNDTYDASFALGDTSVTVAGATGTATGVDIGTDNLSGFERYFTGGGNDIFKFADVGTGAANRTLDANGGLLDTYEFNALGTNLVVTLDTATGAGTIGSGANTNLLFDFENITTKDGNDIFNISGNGGIENTFIAGAGNDTYSNTTGDPLTVNVTNGNGSVTGLAGQTSLDNVQGFENFTTGAGADTFIVNDPTANRLDGAGGVDLFDASAATGNITLNLAAGNGTTAGALGADTLLNIENINTGSGEDVFNVADLSAIPRTLDANSQPLNAGDWYNFTGTGNMVVVHTTTSATASIGTVTDGVNTDNLLDFEDITTAGGTDIFNISDTFGVNNFYDAGAGIDTLVVVNSGAVSPANNVTITLADGSGSMTGTNIGQDTVNNFENVTTAMGNDTVKITTPTTSFGTVDAGLGNDSVEITDSGSNTLTGGGGTDTLHIIMEASGAMTLDTVTYVDDRAAGAGVSSGLITVAGEYDTLATFEVINITGTDNNDTITLIDPNNNTVEAKAGTDIVNVFLAGADTVTITRSGTNNDGANVVVTEAGAPNTSTGTDSLNSVENVNAVGTAGDDYFTVLDRTANIIDGGIGQAAAGDTYDIATGAGTTNVTVNVSAPATQGNYDVIGTNVAGAGTMDKLFSIENIITGGGNDSVTIYDVFSNLINTNTGSDTVTVNMVDSAGADTITIDRVGGNVTVDDMANLSTGTDSLNNVEQVNINGTVNADTFDVRDINSNIINGGTGGIDSYTLQNEPGNFNLRVVGDVTGNTTICEGNINQCAVAPTFKTDTLIGIENITTDDGTDAFFMPLTGNRSLDARGQVLNTRDVYDFSLSENPLTATPLNFNQVGADVHVTTPGGTDTLINFEQFEGDAGSDTFTFSNTAGRILDGEGNTTAGDNYNFNGAGSNVVIQVGVDTLAGNGGITTRVGLDLNNNTFLDAGTEDNPNTQLDELRNIENIKATASANTIYEIYLDKIQGGNYVLDATGATAGSIFRFLGNALNTGWDTEGGTRTLSGPRAITVLVNEALHNLGGNQLDFSGVTGVDNVNVDLGDTTNTQSIFGALSNVSLKFAAGFRPDDVVGLAGNDTIYGNNLNNEIDAAGGNDLLRGGDGDDSLVGGTGKNTLDEQDAVANLSIDLSAAGGQNTGRGMDTLSGIDNVITGDGNDSVTGNNNNNYISTGIGDDTVFAQGGNDSAYLGEGNDSANMEAGTDVVFGEAGNDSLEGGADNDNLLGGEGDDQLLGNAGNDTLRGEAGADSLWGGANNDNLDGGEGVDSTFGGLSGAEAPGNDGNDNITDSGTDGGDWLFGGNDNNLGTDGADTISIVTGGTARNIYGGGLNAGNDTGTDQINLSNGNGDFIVGGNLNDGTGGTDASNNITVDNSTGVTIYGGNNNLTSNGDDTGTDTITLSNSTGSTVFGGNANQGGAGADSGDKINHFNSNGSVPTTSNTIYGGNYNNTGSCVGATCESAGVDDILDAGGKQDTIYGGNFNDSGVGADTGNDNLVTISSNTTMYGGNQNDGGTGTDAGNDNLVDYNGSTTSGGSNTMYGGNFNVSGCAGNTCNDTGSDSITLYSASNTIYGGNRNTGGQGTDGNDVLALTIAVNGNNTVYGGSANSTTSCTGLNCTDGSDTITDQSTGADSLYGGNNNTGSAIANDGADQIDLTSLSGTNGNTAYGGNNNNGGRGTDLGDTINDTNNVNDTIYGGNANNTGTCTGATCADTLTDLLTLSGTGSDTVFGGNRNQAGAGEDGGDSITDSSVVGADSITGGNNNQTGAAGSNETGVDTITSVDGSGTTTATGKDTVCTGHKGTTGTSQAGDAVQVAVDANDTLTVANNNCP